MRRQIKYTQMQRKKFKLWGSFLLSGVFLICLLETHIQAEDNGFPAEMPREEMIKKLEEWSIIPQALSIPPLHEFSIRYEPNLYLKFGTRVRPAHDMTWLVYNMFWNAPEDTFYTAMLIGLDEPSVQEPIHCEYLFWLMINIPGCNIIKGQTICEYQHPRPQNNTGQHRYVYILYKQLKSNISSAEERHIGTWDMEPRYSFSNARFAKKNGFEGPYAANFFIATFLAPTYDFMKGLTTKMPQSLR